MMKKKIKYELVGPELKDKLQFILKNINEGIELLYDVAVRDVKTGAYNFLFFRNMLEIEGAKAKRGMELSLGIFDLDYFKKINDKYGHLTGDKILARLAGVLQNNFRKSDIIARFGGEEFVILMPSTKKERARAVFERVRKAIMNEPFLKKYRVTASGGVAQFLERDNLERFKQRADKALYRAKELGRNRIEVE